MKLKNTTDIDNALIREVIRFVRPPRISNFDVQIKNSKYPYRGVAYHAGNSMHATADPFVTVAIGNPKMYPVIGEERGIKHTQRNGAYRNPTLYNREEALVYVMAHELRHLWQAKIKKGWRSWGSRGQFSEKDAEDYAINKLRAWRKK